MKPLILLSNDDGIRAPGLQALASALSSCAEVMIAAPDRERSASAHAISLDHPLRVEEIAPRSFAIDGTPVDCVYLALHHLVPRKPDLCLSGINNGFNLGSDLFYSGTVGAAREAALRGVPAAALSLERQSSQDFSAAAEFARSLVAELLGRGASAIEPFTFLNVNVPAGIIKGVRLTTMGRRVYRDQVSVRQDLRGKSYYWIGGPETKGDDVAGSDCTAVCQGMVSITPIGLDLTHQPSLSRLSLAWAALLA
ncbi:MAG: 5'/3'-nucleotidase SurE [Polyangia bacterium]